MRTQSERDYSKALRGNEDDNPVTFLDLPRKLRDEIYLLAAVSPSDDANLCCSAAGDYQQSCNILARYRRLAPFRLVSCQVKVDFGEVFHADKDLHVKLPGQPLAPSGRQGSWQSGRICPCREIIAHLKELRLIREVPWIKDSTLPPYKTFRVGVEVVREQKEELGDEYWRVWVDGSTWKNSTWKKKGENGYVTLVADHLDTLWSSVEGKLNHGRNYTEEKDLTYEDIELVRKAIEFVYVRTEGTLGKEGKMTYAGYMET